MTAPVDWPRGHVGYRPAGEHETRALALFRLTPHPDHHHYPCPRWLAGKRCTRDQRCPCRRHHGILDHCRGWLDPLGRTVITSEPYSYRAIELAELIVDLRELGVRVHTSRMSLWFPNVCSLVLIRRHAHPA